VPNLVALSQTVWQRVNGLVRGPALLGWGDLRHSFLCKWGFTGLGLNLNLSCVDGRSLKLTDYYRADARRYLPDRAKTEVWPCEAEATPSQLKNASRPPRAVEPMPRGLHDTSLRPWCARYLSYESFHCWNRLWWSISLVKSSFHDHTLMRSFFSNGLLGRNRFAKPNWNRFLQIDYGLTLWHEFSEFTIFFIYSIFFAFAKHDFFLGFNWVL